MKMLINLVKELLGWFWNKFQQMSLNQSINPIKKTGLLWTRIGQNCLSKRSNRFICTHDEVISRIGDIFERRLAISGKNPLTIIYTFLLVRDFYIFISHQLFS
ncbi:hypothetical protein RIR_jg1735.t1 [Rhizophagus irregularis DAOM 181602=DAOM 197198]|nr:hypothetical protein RIR_jg1735.t1 [Rhizophagus irregularis DAOM 181602=DAOM 197198]